MGYNACGHNVSPMPPRRSDSAFNPEGNFFGSACNLPSTPLSLVDQPSVATNTPLSFIRAHAESSQARSMPPMMQESLGTPNQSVGRPGRAAPTAISPLGSNRARSAPSSTMRLYPSLLSVRLFRKPAVCITSCSSMSGPNAVHVLNPICNGHTRSQARQAPDDDHGTMQSASISYAALHEA